jgi:FKBP-type peptidyl-prolyl cis-trans isomerase SlyD
MTTVAGDHIVSIAYTLTDTDSGEELDKSTKEEPLKYLHGHGQLVPGVEQALEGQTSGHSTKLTLEAADAYGERDEDRVLTVPMERFGDETPEVGAVVQAATADGHAFRLKVTKVEGDEITMDGNHPLAGRKLTFELEVVEVRPATEEELSHGHAHCGGGGCGSCD